LLAQIFLLTVISGFVWSENLGSIGRIWWHSGLFTGTFQVLLGFAIQSLWVLPVVAWLLLISAAVPRLPLMWAILVPLVPITAEAILFRSGVISTHIGKHIEGAALPNYLEGERFMPAAKTLGDQLSLLATADLWLGALLGLVLLYGAVRLRGVQNEI
jgi:ABC-2 type transport system permease protein